MVFIKKIFLISFLLILISCEGDKTYILVEQDETDSVFIINEGMVEVTLTNEAGKELILAFLEEGEVFG